MNSAYLFPKLFFSFSTPADAESYHSLLAPAHNVGNEMEFIRTVKNTVLPKLLDDQTLPNSSRNHMTLDNMPKRQPRNVGTWSVPEMVECNGSVVTILNMFYDTIADKHLHEIAELDLKGSFKWPEAQVQACGLLTSRLMKAFEILGLLLEAPPEIRCWQLGKDKTYYYCLRYATFVDVPDQELPKPILVDVAIRTT